MRYSRDLRARQPGGRRTLTQQALAILARYGSAANLYLPGIGAINGITAGNWLDSAGTAAATVDNPVGLVASAGKQVGPERITNGDFGSGTTGWTPAANASLSNSGGAMRLRSTISGIGARLANQTVTGLTVGATYLVIASVYSFGGAGAQGNYPQVQIRNASDTATIASIGASAFTNTTIFGTFVATESTQRIRPRWDGDAATNSTSYLDFDDISLRELPGAHLTQPTTANKPILKLFSGAYFWDFVSSDFFASSLTAADREFVCSSVNVSSLGATRAIYSAGQHTASVAGARYRVNATGEISLIGGDGSARDIFTSTAQVSAGQTSVVSAGWDESVTAFIGVGLTEQNFTKTVSYAGSSASQLGVLNVSSEPFAGLIGSTVIMTTVLPNAAERTTLRKFIASLSGVAL